MRALWHALHAKLVRSTGTLSFQKQFDTMRRRAASLHQFPDPAGLLDHLHTTGGSGTERNAILREIVAIAQAETGDCAAIVMILALWPGLDAVYGRLWQHYRSCPQDLVAEISERVVIATRTLNPDRVTWVAATIIKNVERDIRRGLGAGWAETALRVEMPDDVAVGQHRSLLGWPDGFQADLGLLDRQLRRWMGADADLLMAVAIVGETQEEAGARVGLGPDAVRKRYQRARQRLRTRIAEIA